MTQQSAPLDHEGRTGRAMVLGMTHELELVEAPTALWDPKSTTTMTGLEVPVACAGCDWVERTIITDPKRMHEVIDETFAGHLAAVGAA